MEYLNELCTFEDPNVCSYTQATGDDFDWIRKNGKATSITTGPTLDHTYGSSDGMLKVLLACLVLNDKNVNKRKIPH